jgi:hypothetical protein
VKNWWIRGLATLERGKTMKAMHGLAVAVLTGIVMISGWAPLAAGEQPGSKESKPSPKPVGEPAASQSLLAAGGNSGTKPPKPETEPAAVEEQEKILRTLESKREWDYADVPLATVAATLGKELGVDVILNATALDNVGVGSDVPVTFRARAMSVRCGLRHLLRPLGLTWLIRDRAVVITTAEDAESELDLRVYPVGDLVRPAEGTAQGEDYDSLIDTITSTIQPNSWDAVGGPGAIQGLDQMLVVSQTREVHEQIERLLADVRLAGELHRNNPQQVSMPFIAREADADAMIRRSLQKTARCDTKEKELTLASLVETLQKQCDFPVLVDVKALEDTGIATDAPLAAPRGQLPMAVLGSRVLRPVSLTWVVRDEALLVTTPEQADAMLLTRVYPVHDLQQPSPAEKPSKKYDAIGLPISGTPSDSLLDVLTSTVAPQSWDAVGGAGSVQALTSPPVLVIAQTESVHEQVLGFLAKLRKGTASPAVPQAPGTPAIRARPAKKRGSSTEGYMPGMPGMPGAADMYGAMYPGAMPSAPELALRVYVLTRTTTIPSADGKKEPEVRVEKPPFRVGELARIIRKTVEPQSWESTEGVLIEPLGETLVIRHTEAVHRHIQRVLTHLGVSWLGAGPWGFGSGAAMFGPTMPGF